MKKLLSVAIFLLSCAPATNSKLETEAKEAVACLNSPVVQDCLKGFGCSGPAKQCAAARAVYSLSCLELCAPPDAGTD